MKGSRIYRFPELRKVKDNAFDTFKGLHGLLADALPDRYGNQLINIWLAQQGRPADSMNPVEQLCFIGSRAVGALEFEPAQLPEHRTTFNIDSGSLVETAQRLLSGREDFSTNPDADEERRLKAILRVGTSAGRVRPKTVIGCNPNTGDVRSCQTKVTKGYDH
jgi:serine/threonine-protein kinase HipA